MWIQHFIMFKKHFWLILESHFRGLVSYLYFFVDVSSVQVHGKINQQVKFASDHHLAPFSASFFPFRLLPGGPFYPLAGCRAASGLKEKWSS